MRPTRTIEPYAHLAAATYLIRHSHDPALVVMRCDDNVALATLGYFEIARAIADGKDPETCLVVDVATRSRATTRPSAVAGDAARSMQLQGLHRLPVVEGRKLLGIIELADCLAQNFPASAAEASS